MTDLETISFLTGFVVGGLTTGISIYRGRKPQKIYIEHSKEGIVVQILNQFGSRRYTTRYKIRPEDYDGRKRTDVLSKELREGN